MTADCIVITKEAEPKVLLIERGDKPFKGCWAFPGGFMNMDETTEQCAIRELEEETGLTVSGQDDAAKAQWFPLTAFLDKPSGKAERPELAFDHKEIMTDAIKKYKQVRETAVQPPRSNLKSRRKDCTNCLNKCVNSVLTFRHCAATIRRKSNQPRVYMKKKLLFSVAIALLMLAGCNSKSEPAKNTSAPSFDEVLTTRRSVRSYDATKKISEAEVRELLLATQEAPSWANQQPTKYYVAISEEKLKAVQDMVGGNKERIKDAPVLIVSTFERGKSGFFQGNQTNEVGDGWGAYDNGLSNCHLVLKARAMGFDTLIMGMRDADALRSLFSIPESETIMAVISLGYRAGEPNRPERRPLDDIVKFF